MAGTDPRPSREHRTKAAEPYFREAVTKDDGTGLRYVVALPDDLAHALEVFLRRHEQEIGAAVKSAADRGRHDRALAEEFAGTVHARQDVTGALGIVERQGH